MYLFVLRKNIKATPNCSLDLYLKVAKYKEEGVCSLFHAKNLVKAPFCKKFKRGGWRLFHFITKSFTCYNSKQNSEHDSAWCEIHLEITLSKVRVRIFSGFTFAKNLLCLFDHTATTMLQMIDYDCENGPNFRSGLLFNFGIKLYYQLLKELNKMQIPN